MGCLSCGCDLPNTDHGDPRHITLADLMDAGKAAGIDAMQAAENIGKTMDYIVGDAKPGEWPGPAPATNS